jgi:organic hydroperoxide reductase OsmC/OhrA
VSEHRVSVAWDRNTEDFQYETYSRDHTWTFESGIEMAASAAPLFRGNADHIDPEESFVASLASCHMLTFLAIAARKKWTVDRYVDTAIGTLDKNEDGRLAMTRVVLRPRIAFSGAVIPSPEDIDRTHQSAHRNCFIANSVKTEVVVDWQQD